MKEALKAMLQDIINDRHEEAAVALHSYIVGKTQETVGLTEAKFIAKVEKKEKWHAPEGFFEKSAKAIASGLKRAHDGLKPAMASLSFEINRAGKGMSAEQKEKLEHAKELLRAMYEEEDLDDDLLTEGVHEIVAKIAKSTGIPHEAAHVIFVGGDHPKMKPAHLEKLEKDGYDSAGAWVENKDWFKKHNVSKTEFNQLVKASL